jgi:predicted DNA-binding transcriptional regulator AlpA
MKRFLTPDDMVAILGLPSRRTLYSTLHSHPDTLPAPIRVGRRLRWHEDDVATFFTGRPR